MEIYKAFSDGLGFDSKSLFITLKSNHLYDLADLQQYYENIEECKMRDLMFKGNIIENSQFLKWLTAQLIAEDYYISLILDLVELHEHGMYLGCFAQRTIIVVKELFRKWSEIFNTIDKTDILLIKNADINILRRVAQQSTDRKNEAWIYFDEEILDREQVLKSELRSIYPYRGII